MRLLNLVICFLLSIQLSGQEKMALKSDDVLVDVFDTQEIVGLKKMIEFVDKMVLNHTNETEVNKAYHKYFEEIARTEEYIVPFEESEKYEFLESLDSIQFSSIWVFDYYMDMIRTKDTVYRNLENFKTLQVKPMSKYMDYLKEVGKGDAYFQHLQQEFEGAGNLMQDSSEWFVRNHEKFDFNIPKNHLWAVVYLLRREETIEMKLNRYINNK